MCRYAPRQPRGSKGSAARSRHLKPWYGIAPIASLMWRSAIFPDPATWEQHSELDDETIFLLMDVDMYRQGSQA